MAYLDVELDTLGALIIYSHLRRAELRREPRVDRAGRHLEGDSYLAVNRSPGEGAADPSVWSI